MVLKPMCSWCKDHNQFKKNQHVENLIFCFAKICECIKNSTLIPHIEKYDRENKVKKGK